MALACQLNGVDDRRRLDHVEEPFAESRGFENGMRGIGDDQRALQGQVLGEFFYEVGLADSDKNQFSAGFLVICALIPDLLRMSAASDAGEVPQKDEDRGLIAP